MSNEEALEILEGIREPSYEELKDTLDLSIYMGKEDSIKKVRAESVRRIEAGHQVEDYYELCKRSYLGLAEKRFDDYLIYLEWDRPAEKKFYLPRRRILSRVVNELQMLEDGDLEEIFLQMPPRVGKLVENSILVLTKDGWKRHGDLAVGDEVIGLDGKFKKVTYVFPKEYANVRVHFTNGEYVDVHENHEWYVYDRGVGKYVVLETKKMMSQKYVRNEGKKERYKYQLPISEFVIGEEKELPVKPYTLGAWLGDGSNKTPRLTNDKNDIAIIEGIEEEGYEIRHTYIHKTYGTIMNVFNDLRQDLQKCGMCYSRKIMPKHIPEEYFTASIEQRLKLLAGLLDTDGTLDKKEHRYHYSTTSKELKDDFVTLISTFGWRASVTEYEPRLSSSNIQGKKKVYTIGFNPTTYIPCRLERKQLREFSKQRRVSICGFERIEPKEGNCISVEGGIYRVGRTLIPTHNSSIVMFFLTWIMGKYPDNSNLYVAFSDMITRAMYSGVMEILTDEVTYLWKDVFPDKVIADTNSKDETINIERHKRYPTLTCRSLYGSLNGACDCDKYLISDDLLSGIEEALNPTRLETAWGHVDNNMLTRAKSSAKKIWIGTLWSTKDPISTRKMLLLESDKYKSIKWKDIQLPALNEKDESNFDYDYGVGFNTEYYIQRRSSFEINNDMASWLAQYQQAPIDRQGALFEPTTMNYYNGVLPEAEPNRIYMACDVAWGGGDYFAAAIVYSYDEGDFVEDVIYNDGDKYITRPIVVDKILKHKIQAVQFEANNGGHEYADIVNDTLKEQNYRCNITSATAPSNKKKEIRIYDKSPEIRELYFRDTSCRTKEYSKFMQNLFSFTVTGKNLHDKAIVA